MLLYMRSFGRGKPTTKIEKYDQCNELPPTTNNSPRANSRFFFQHIFTVLSAIFILIKVSQKGRVKENSFEDIQEH